MCPFLLKPELRPLVLDRNICTDKLFTSVFWKSNDLQFLMHYSLFSHLVHSAHFYGLPKAHCRHDASPSWWALGLRIHFYLWVNFKVYNSPSVLPFLWLEFVFWPLGTVRNNSWRPRNKLAERQSLSYVSWEIFGAQVISIYHKTRFNTAFLYCITSAS